MTEPLRSSKSRLFRAIVASGLALGAASVGCADEGGGGTVDALGPGTCVSGCPTSETSETGDADASDAMVHDGGNDGGWPPTK